MASTRTRNRTALRSFLTAASAFSLFVGCTPAEDFVDQVTATSTNIVNGTEATQAQVGATVALLGGGLCSGTLIAPSVVLTAAHCGEEGWDFDVVAGVVDAENAGQQFRHAVAQAIPHPGYNPNAAVQDNDGMSAWNDVAVLILETPITNIAPVPVLPMAQVNGVLTNGVSLELAGYGVLSENGQQAGTLFITETPFVRENGTELLAGGQSLPDTCYGDSGGPAYVLVGGQKFVAGITSRGALSAGECGDGGIYTLASAYTDFIDSAVAGNEDPAPEGAAPEGEPDFDPGDGSCLDRCDEEFDDSQDCACDDDCEDWGDCCPDYVDICVDGNIPTPDAPTPDAPSPEAVEPDTPSPDASEPDFSEPEFGEPDVSEPDAPAPDASEPDVAQPDVSEPEAVPTDPTPEAALGPESGEPEVVMEPEANVCATDDCRPNVRSRMVGEGCSSTSAPGMLPFALLGLAFIVRRRRLIRRRG